MQNVSLDILTAPGCTNCRTFLEFWATEGKNWPNVAMKEVDILTPEGQAMAGEFLIFASPGIVLDDELIATGGWSKEHILSKLKELSLG